MKIVLCQRGNVRSATTVAILRDCYGELDVFAIGVDTMSPEFLRSFTVPVQVFIVGDASVVQKFERMEPGASYLHLDVGVDHWLAPMHPDLVGRVILALKAHGYSDYSPIYIATANYEAANAERWQQLHGFPA